MLIPIVTQVVYLANRVRVYTVSRDQILWIDGAGIAKCQRVVLANGKEWSPCTERVSIT